MHDDREDGMDAEWNSIGLRKVRDGEREGAIVIDPPAMEGAAEGASDVLRLPTYGAERAFSAVLDRYRSFLRASSWQLAWYDRDLREDLEQEGRIALWRLNPVRLTAVVNPDGYRRAAIRYAMLRHLRTLSRQDPADKRIDWRIVEEVLETFGERRGGGRRAA